MDNTYYHGYVLVVLFTDSVRANSTSTDTGSSNTSGLKIAISCGVIIFALVSALIIAKLFNMWLSRRADIPDDGSDISDNTRDLIRARLAVIQYKKRQLDKSKKTNIKEFFLRWSETVNRKKLIKSQSSSKENNIVLNTENIVEVKENGTAARSPRLPIFSGETSQKALQKQSKDSFSGRTPATQRTVHVSSATSNSTTIVAKGRPVSSRSHILSSSSQTNTSTLFIEQKNASISAPLTEQKHTTTSAPPIEQQESSKSAIPTEQKQTNTPAQLTEERQTTKTVQFENATKLPQPPDISS